MFPLGKCVLENRNMAFSCYLGLLLTVLLEIEKVILIAFFRLL